MSKQEAYEKGYVSIEAPFEKYQQLLEECLPTGSDEFRQFDQGRSDGRRDGMLEEGLIDAGSQAAFVYEPIEKVQHLL